MAGCATPAPATAVAVTAAPSASRSLGPGLGTDHVPVSRPTHLAFPAAEIDGPVEEYTAGEAEVEGGINPRSLQTIAWYSGIPEPLPGTDATNTVYIFGHTWVEPAVFNGLAAVAPGDMATLETETGTLTYVVDEIVVMDKTQFSTDPTVSAIVPGRLVLVTCHRPDGWDADALAPDNTAVVLHLVGSRARP